VRRTRGEPVPFNQEYDTGRKAYREDWEEPDDRPALRVLEPFWADKTEQMAYEDAAEADRPRPEDSLLTYLARVSAAVLGKYKGVLPKMRRPGLSRVDRERRMQQLRGQLPGKTEVL